MRRAQISSIPKQNPYQLFTDDLYKAGKLKIDEMVTRTYPLDEINKAFEAMEKGEVARSVIVY